MLSPDGGGSPRSPAHRHALIYAATGPGSSLSLYCLTSKLPARLATNNLLQTSLFAPIRQLITLPLNSLQSVTQLGTQLVLIKTFLNLNLPTFPCPPLHLGIPQPPGMHSLLTFLRAG